MMQRVAPEIAKIPIAGGLQTGEGPVLLPDGSILCCEVRTGRLLVMDQHGNRSGSFDLGGGPNGAALGPDGRCYACNNGGINAQEIEYLSQGKTMPGTSPSSGSIQAVDLKSGDVQTLYTCCEGVALMAPNDLVFDVKGGFYFTDHGNLKDPAPLKGAVYYARADGSAIHLIDADVTRPNGIGLSPDGAVVYVAETATGRVWAYPVTAPGQVDSTDRREFYHEEGLNLDSLAVQADGRVCVASPPQNLILRVGQDSAQHIATPPGWPSNIAFGGDGLRTAYITSIISGEIWKADWDCAGLPLAF